MSTLVRDDGTPFVMQAYRELLTAEKKSLLAHRVRLLAGQHGQYVRLLKKGHGEYEAVFSPESGYLLGETVKQYFGHPDHLIFCEALPNSTDILLVVIRDGSVYLDALIAAKNIRHELLPLITNPEKYHIVTSGSVPIEWHPESNAFTLPHELVYSFEKLDEPLFPRLSVIRSLQLLSLPLALRAERLTGQPFYVALLFVAAIAIGLGYYWLQVHKDQRQKPAVETVPAAYQIYDQALITPAPQRQLNETYNLIQVLYSLPGWKATAIHFRDHRYDVSVSSEGADLEALNTWAKQHEFQFQLTQSSAILVGNSATPPRPKPDNIYSTQLVLTAIIDELDGMLHGKRLSIQQTIHHDAVVEVQLSLALQEDTPKTLLLIGETLKDLPVTINQFELTLKPGSLSGTINLSVWGKENESR